MSRRAFAGLSWQVTGSIACRVLGLARLALFAPLLGPEGFGAFRLAGTASTIMAAPAGLGLYASYLRFLPEARRREVAAGLFRRGVFLSLLTSSVAAALMMLSPCGISRLVFSDPRYTALSILIAISLPVIVLYKSTIGAAQGAGDFRGSSLAEVVQNAAFLVVGMVALRYLSASPAVAFAASLFAMATGILWLMCSKPSATLRSMYRNNVATPDAGDPDDVFGAVAQVAQTAADVGLPLGIDEEVNALFRRALRFSAWFAVIPIFSYLFDFVDRWMLARLLSLKQAGTYSLAPVIAGGMFFVGSSLSSVVTRRGAWLLGHGNEAAAHRQVWAGSSLSVFASLGYVVAVRAVEPWLWRMAGPSWAEAASALPYTLTYYAFYNSFYLLGSFAAFAEKPWVNMLAGFFGVAANIVLNLTMIPRFGIVGAAGATLISLTVMMACHVVFALVRGINMPGRAWLLIMLPVVSLLPGIWTAVALAMALFVWFRTNVLCSDSERRIVLAWQARMRRSFMIRTGLGGQR